MADMPDVLADAVVSATFLASDADAVALLEAEGRWNLLSGVREDAVVAGTTGAFIDINSCGDTFVAVSQVDALAIEHPYWGVRIAVTRAGDDLVRVNMSRPANGRWGPWANAVAHALRDHATAVAATRTTSSPPWDTAAAARALLAARGFLVEGADDELRTRIERTLAA